MSFAHVYARTVLRPEAVADPPDRDDIRAMAIVLRIDKGEAAPHPADLLAAAARACAAVCLDPRGEPGGPWTRDLDAWAGARIRKIARRARGAHWEAAQQVPGVTVTVGGAQARACVPTRLGDVDRRIARLQIGGTDLSGRLPPTPAESAAVDELVLWCNPGLAMSIGKLAAQVGHGASLGMALLGADGAARWYGAGAPLQIARGDPARWPDLLGAADRGAALAVRDAGYTEIAPGSVTVIAQARGA